MMALTMTIHGALLGDLLEDGAALLVEPRVRGVREDLESLPLDGIADRHGDARGDHLHAQHRRGAAQVDEVDGALQRAGDVLLEVEALDRTERAGRKDGIVGVALRPERARHGRPEAVEDERVPDAVAHDPEGHHIGRAHVTVCPGGLPV